MEPREEVKELAKELAWLTAGRLDENYIQQMHQPARKLIEKGYARPSKPVETNGLENMKERFEQIMLDGDKVEDCGRCMLEVGHVWDYIKDHCGTTPAAKALDTNTRKGLSRFLFALGKMECGFSQADKDYYAMILRKVINSHT